MKQTLTRSLLILFILVIAESVFVLLHETLFIGIAAWLHELTTSDLLYSLVHTVLSSPIHAKLMLETLGGIQTHGIAFVGLPRVVIDKESTVLSVLIVRWLTEFCAILAGLGLVKIGWPKSNLRTAIENAPVRTLASVGVGLLVFVQAVWAIFNITLAPNALDLRDTGIGVGFSLLLQLDTPRYNWLMDQVLPLAIPLTLIGIAFLVAALLEILFERIQRFFVKPNARAVKPSPQLLRPVWFLIALVIAIAVLSALSYHPHLASSRSIAPNFQAMAFEKTPTAVPPTATPTHALPTGTPATAATVVSTLTTTPTLRPTLTPSPTPSPTPVVPAKVQVQLDGKKFRLLVNAQPITIAGINYNVNYTRLAEDIKQKYHRRDFKIMRDAGVNAIIGWGVYDETTLTIAQEFGLGVIMPYELDAKGAYENKNYREQIKSEYGKFIKRFQKYPAVWGWNPGGDELLHRMETEFHRTPDKLQAASDFLVELSTYARSLDPDRVSVIKEPRDWYIPYIEDSLRRERKQSQDDPSHYFVYAVNTYGKPEGVALVLRSTRQAVEERLKVAMLVGEFAPFGLARADRAKNYATIWDVVQETSGIGGFAYVFGPDQPNPNSPNPYDPLRLLVNEFSLVDFNGNPVDDSLNALTNKWQSTNSSPAGATNSAPALQ